MTREEWENAIRCLKLWIEKEPYIQTYKTCLEALEQESCEDAISREAIKKDLKNCMVTEIRDKDDDLVGYYNADTVDSIVRNLPPVKPQEPKTRHYEKHIDHTDCIWYGSDSGCPVTCSQYRDGWNDAMDYIFKNGKGYQPYRHDG